jgi:hypothetical protein
MHRSNKLQLNKCGPSQLSESRFYCDSIVQEEVGED